MHSTVIFIEGFSNSRLEQWFQASQVLSRIICMAKGFCSWHLTNSYDEQLQYAATLAKRDTIFLSRPRAMSSSLGRLFSSETAPGSSFSQSSRQAKQKKIDIDITCITWDTVWTHLRCNTTVPIEKEHRLRSKVPASNVFMRPDTTTPAPEFPVFVWAYKTHAFSCHVASLEKLKGFTYAKCIKHHLNWEKKHWNMLKRMQTFPARKSWERWNVGEWDDSLDESAKSEAFVEPH